jgi:hypothetical protein
MFDFNSVEFINKASFAENYRLHQRITKKLQHKELHCKTDKVTFGLFCRLKEISKQINFKEPKPEDFGLTQDQIESFLRNDRYVSANLLLKQIEFEKQQALSKARKEIIAEYNKKKELWWEFTKKGQKKHEDDQFVWSLA